MLSKFSCFLIGEESLLIQCGEILLNKGHKILGIFSGSKSIVKWAAEQNIKIVETGFTASNVLTSQPYDFLFSITNLSIIPEEIVKSPLKMAINFHDGPLPKYAGINATSWALMDNIKEYGITWHEITTEIDKGDILKQVMFEVEENENALSLNAKCFQAGIISFSELVDELETDNIVRIKQDFSKRTYYGKFKRPENACIINWNQDAKKISTFTKALNFVRYKNSLGIPKIIINDEFFLIPELEATNIKSTLTPGKISEISEDRICISTCTEDVKINKILSLKGRLITLPEFKERFTLSEGFTFKKLNIEKLNILNDLNSQLARKENFWTNELGNYELVDIHYADKTSQRKREFKQLKMNFPPEVIKSIESYGNSAQFILPSLFGLFIGKHSGKENYTLGFSYDNLKSEIEPFNNLFADFVPFNINFSAKDKLDTSISLVLEKMQKAIASKTFAIDVFARYPSLAGFFDKIKDTLYPVSVYLGDNLKPDFDSLLLFNSTFDPKVAGLVFDSSVISEENGELLRNQFNCFVEQALNNPSALLSSISFLSPYERKQIFQNLNNTKTDFPSGKTIHDLIEEQVRKTPGNEAVFCKGKSITYDELNKKSNQLARKLRKLGVKSETLVGISLHRSVDMIVAIFGILKAGGAYVPLDPDFPIDRIHYMINDSNCSFIISEEKVKSTFITTSANIIFIDSDWEEISYESGDNLDKIITSDNLAYMIYTSGSTGKPKGVMVEHRNVVNFFTGMDKQIKFDPPGVWLAVTSLSFDISVFELLWTLTHGFKVVIYAEEDWKTEHIKQARNEEIRKLDFSLFYFSSYENNNQRDKYRLLLEGAKFADQNRFSAVWTPERHFHEFGGLFPNPSVTGAGLATITEHVRIMSGSCVSPLHNPIRITEEWSVVDNLSNGRVGISFAAGWQPNDFTLMPQNYERRKDIMFEQIEIVRKLWRGETVQFKGPDGRNVDIKTLPRPVQKELPVWITAANNPETFQMAGEKGFYLLTHLLGQSIDELAEKIELYKKAWKQSGHGPGEGYVSLMLHTFIGENIDEVREIVREPMKQYLKSAASLVKLASWYFPTFEKMDDSFNEAASNLTDEDMDAILNYSFERYFDTSSLLGTPDICNNTLNKLKKAGVDDVACLIDFGIEPEEVMAHLHYINALKTITNIGVTENKKTEDEQFYSISDLIINHNVTHLQCTPSMAKMLLLENEVRDALKYLKYLMIGGEVFPVSLAAQLREIVNGEIYNLYGPTETTIWSSIYKLNGMDNSIPIGEPIANTEIVILDQYEQVAPLNVPGELCIGGHGVVRGYFERPELTTQRFIEYSFNGERDKRRIYRTGDLAMINRKGKIEFLGRIDHQVKIRGYRIELGEIESLLEKHPYIREAVVVAREKSSGDKRLVAYLVGSNSKLDNTNLKNYLRESLPDYMVPSTFIIMDKFPLTPNGKVDRKALPEPDNKRTDDENSHTLPETDTEKRLVSLWSEVLGIGTIRRLDNFFELGGHSLSAVQITVKIHQTFNVNISLQSFFQCLTLADLALLVEDKMLQLASTHQLDKLLKELEQDSNK